MRGHVLPDFRKACRVPGRAPTTFYSPMHRARGAFITLILLRVATLFLPDGLAAAEIKGTVLEATADTAKIAIEGGLVPQIGDRVKIFYKVSGFEAEFSVAAGRVTKVDTGFVQATIESADGQVERGLLVKIASEGSKEVATPMKGKVPGAAAAFAGALLGLAAAGLLSRAVAAQAVTPPGGRPKS